MESRPATVDYDGIGSASRCLAGAPPIATDFQL
jgi:hypothetical protein